MSHSSHTQSPGITHEPNRMEILTSLLTTMALVVMTGKMPQTDEPKPCKAINVTAKPQVVVPLVQRFADLESECGYHHLRFKGGFFPRRFIEAEFGLRWRRECDYLLELSVMPSTVLRALALEMAEGDIERAQVILNTRATKGLYRAIDNVARRFTAPCLVSRLWRFGGNPDVIWIALRDQLLRVRGERAA